jgi:hypothetical protein
MYVTQDIVSEIKLCNSVVVINLLYRTYTLRADENNAYECKVSVRTDTICLSDRNFSLFLSDTSRYIQVHSVLLFLCRGIYLSCFSSDSYQAVEAHREELLQGRASRYLQAMGTRVTTRSLTWFECEFYTRVFAHSSTTTQ